ncbi:MAG: matrixin family metalloprotease [Bryobacteraceae bacterium]
MRRLRTLTLVIGTLIAGITPSAAYYHYIRYTNAGSPYAAIYEKFDLSALPNKTVTFFVSDSGPTQYSTNDSFASVLGQVREATLVWNRVPTSDLRVAFGGLETTGTPQNTPGGEVVFEELPPGLLAFAGPAATADTVQGTSGSFVPIVKSLIHLNIDLTKKPGPSYLESFFTTVVHEMGHALGLQHTFTSATMSTAVTRATSRVRPLDADDIAGISLLYPRGAFPSAFGSISGTVTASDQGVHLASVVALMPNGSAVSTLTNPDGSYEIDGVPAGDYWVYVHPLPPTADIVYPLDTNANPVLPSAPFVTTFYPGTADPSQFVTVTVSAGATATGINFSVQPRSAVEIYDVTTYSFPGSYAVQPAYLNVTASALNQVLVANGPGITTGADAASGLTIQVLGGFGSIPYTAYGDPDTNLAIYPTYPAVPASGPEHLLFKLPDDIYVLPRAVNIVQAPPPAIAGVAANSDGSVTVTGTGMASDSKIFFDSLPGRVTVPYAAATSGDNNGSSDTSQSGSVTVMPPPGASGQVSTITIFNSDSQSSMFVQAQSPFTFTYPQTSAPAAAISLSSLPAGASSMVDVTTSDLQFVDRTSTTLGFGSGDVTVRRLWVLGPNHIIANVTASPSAAQTTTSVSVLSGFQAFDKPAGFQIQAPDPNQPLIALPVSNAFASQNSLYPGALASMYGANLVTDSGNPAITIGGLDAQVLYASAKQINFVVPAGVPVGPAVLKLNNGSTDAFPLVLQIDPRPPVIIGLTSSSGTPLDSSQASAPGDSVVLVVFGLDPAVVSDLSRVSVTEGGVDLAGFTVQAAPENPNLLLIQVALSSSVTGIQIPLTVSLDGDLSMPFYINVAAPAGS